jgi:hypothetical protein
MKEAVRKAEPETDEEMKARAHADLDLAVENGRKKEPNVMRPVASEVGPEPPKPVAAAPVEAPPPPTKPAAPPKPPRPPKKAPPAEGTTVDTPKPGPYWELHKKLAEEKISHERFLLVMFDFNFLPGIEREDISNGSIALSKLDEKAIRAALSDWKTVTENLPPV